MRNDISLIADIGDRRREGLQQAVGSSQARLIEVLPVGSSWGIVSNHHDLIWLCSTPQKANQRALEFGADAGSVVRTAP
jgi:hypothetical protein